MRCSRYIFTEKQENYPFLSGATLKCLNIGTPKTIYFPFVPNGKLIIFSCPKIWAHYSLIIMFSNIGTSKIINFPFGTNGKLMVSGVLIFKHFRICTLYQENKIFPWRVSSLEEGIQILRLSPF